MSVVILVLINHLNADLKPTQKSSLKVGCYLVKKNKNSFDK